MTDETEDGEQAEASPRVLLAIDALPFTQIDADNGDQLLRQWIIKEVVHPDTPMTKGTIQFLEDLYQWTKFGLQEPKAKVVK